MPGEDWLKRAESGMDSAVRASDTMALFLDNIGLMLKYALFDSVKDAARQDERWLEDWIDNRWHETAAHLMWMIRLHHHNEVLGPPEKWDWFNAEKLLGFLIADMVLPTASECRLLGVHEVGENCLGRAPSVVPASSRPCLARRISWHRSNPRR